MPLPRPLQYRAPGVDSGRAGVTGGVDFAELVHLDPGQQATIANVTSAVVQLREFDESVLLEMASAGQLQQVFPFRLREGELPRDAMAESDVAEASPEPTACTASALDLIKVRLATLLHRA